MFGGRSNRNPRHIVVAAGETGTKSVRVGNHESCGRARCCTMTAVGCSVVGLHRLTNGYCSRYDCDSRLYLGLHHAGSHHFVNRRRQEHVKDGVPQEGVLNDVGSVA
jgi:hypothetical protein